MMSDMFKNLQPHYSIPDLSKPYSVSGNLTILNPSTSIIANSLSDSRDGIGVDTISESLARVEVSV